MVLRTTILLALCAASAPAQGLTVQSMSPAPRSLGASTAAAIQVTFQRDVDLGTVDGRSFRVFGRWSGVHPGTYAFGASQRTIVFTPERPFFPTEMVTVMLSAAVAGPGGVTLRPGFTATFWVGASRGNGTFTNTAILPVRRAGEGLITTYGIYAGDLDRDGSIDLSAVNEDSADVRVALGDGCGGFSSFVSHPLTPGAVPSTNEGQDFDGDGFTDLAVGGIQGNDVTVFLGDGLGGYRPAVRYPSGTAVRGLAVLDVDSDGHVDIATANRVSSNVSLHVNRGDGTFHPARFLEAGGNNETGIAAGDANGDGIQDLWVAHFLSNRVTVLLGDGAGNFTLAGSASVGSRPWMIVLGDVTGDGHLDAVTCNSSSSTISVVPGDGAGGLQSAQHYASGSFPLAIDVGDLDADGRLDVIASNYSGGTFTVYRNLGGGQLGGRVDLRASRAGSCAVIADYDRDGVADILGIDELADLVFLFRQDVSVPTGVQPMTCEAALRIDERAAHAGYATAPPLDVVLGARTTLNVSTAAGVAHQFLFGLPLDPGLPSAFGWLNLDLATLVPGATGLADGFGEGRWSFDVPATLPPGSTVAVQAVVAPAAGLRVTNPLVVRIVP